MDLAEFIILIEYALDMKKETEFIIKFAIQRIIPKFFNIIWKQRNHAMVLMYVIVSLD